MVQMCSTTALGVLLMVSFVVLHADAAEQAAIRLPSEGEEVEAMSDVDVGDKKIRPWKCCDLPLCTKSIPPICQCVDTVKKCAPACKNCVKSSSGHVCTDTYTGSPGRACTKPKLSIVVAEEERPWTCCTRTVYTRMSPPIVRCTDLVRECQPACKDCRQIFKTRYMCKDSYEGNPGPAC